MNVNDEKYAFNFFVDDSKDIKSGTQKIMSRLLESIVSSDYTKIESMLKESKSMRYSIQGYEEYVDISVELKSKLVSAGYASALVDAMQLYVEKVSAQNEILKINTKYRDRILKILERRGTLLHNDLASELGVSASALNAIIKQMNGTGTKLISVEKVSKYKLYSLTPIAYKYIRKHNLEQVSVENSVLGQWEAKYIGRVGCIEKDKYKGCGMNDLYVKIWDNMGNVEVKKSGETEQKLAKYGAETMYFNTYKLVQKKETPLRTVRALKKELA